MRRCRTSGQQGMNEERVSPRQRSRRYLAMLPTASLQIYRVRPKKNTHTRKHTHTPKVTRAHLPLTQVNLPVTTSSVALWSLFTCLRCFWPTKHRSPSPSPPPAGIYRHMALCKALRTDVLLLSFLTDILGEWVIFFSFIAFHRTTLRGFNTIRVCRQTGSTPSRIKCYDLPVWLFNAVELQPNKYRIAVMAAKLPSLIAVVQRWSRGHVC